MAIWNIVQTFGIFYDYLVHFVFIWYIFSGFGIMHQGKSGNPESVSRRGVVILRTRKNVKVVNLKYLTLQMQAHYY
jgi:hypothetical protein